MQIPGLPPQPAAPQLELNFAPLPTKLDLGSVQLPDGNRLLVFTFSTPQGVNAFFVSAEHVERLCNQMRAEASGLTVVGQ